MADGITVTTHYTTTDPECVSDYYDIEVNLYLGHKHFRMEYGDNYHDSGQSKAQGFIDAIRVMYGSKFPVIYVDVADREDLG